VIVVSRKTIVVAALALAASAAPGAAQTAPDQAAAQPAPRSADDRVQTRFQISQLERLLEGAVEHGATLFRQRFQAALPSQLLITDNARARGFRLEGYGVFFDVEVPGVEGTALAWAVRALDQNDLGLDGALKELKAAIGAKGDTNVQQALRRIELQLTPAMAVAAANPAPTGGARAAAGALASVADPTPPHDPILSDPLEVFRAEVVNQIKDAMLQYSAPLALQDDEWLTIAARRPYDRPLVAPADSDPRTVIIRIRGGDLAAFRANRLSRDEALKKIDIREF
jgi:hypothetical protein